MGILRGKGETAVPQAEGTWKKSWILHPQPLSMVCPPARVGVGAHPLGKRQAAGLPTPSSSSCPGLQARPAFTFDPQDRSGCQGGAQLSRRPKFKPNKAPQMFLHRQTPGETRSACPPGPPSPVSHLRPQLLFSSVFLQGTALAARRGGSCQGRLWPGCRDLSPIRGLNAS